MKDTGYCIECNFDRSIHSPFIEGKHTITTERNLIIRGGTAVRVLPVSECRGSQENRFNFSGNLATLLGRFVKYNKDTRDFVSEIYGFLVYLHHKISVIPLIKNSEDQLKTFLYITPLEEGVYPDAVEIQHLLDAIELVHSVESYEIDEQIKNLQSTASSGWIQVGQGNAPVDGLVEHVVLRKKMDLAVGRELGGGRMDFKEKEFFHRVVQDEIISELIPQVPPVDGVNPFNKTIPGILKGSSNYTVGENLELQQQEKGNFYVSTIDGILNIQKDNRNSAKQKIGVTNHLVIQEDVDWSTGNVRFQGTVEIHGNVTPGFEVKAENALEVWGNIEEASVEAGGDIRVKNGIIGKKKCKVVSTGGKVEARFIQVSEVVAAEDIVIHESVIQAKCFSGSVIRVTDRVIGGELYACHGVEVGSAGASSEVKTILSSGYHPILEKEIEEIEQHILDEITLLNITFGKITEKFGENVLENIRTEKLALAPNKKEELKVLLDQVKKINAKVQDYKQQKQLVEDKFHEHPYVLIENKCFRNVLVRVKEVRQTILEPLSNRTRFILDPKNRSLSSSF